MTSEERLRRRFSESFRKEQVALIESGELTILDISKLYEVKTASIKRWLIRFGKNELPPQMIVTNSKDYNRISKLEKEVKNLKEIIGDQRVKIIVQKKLISKAKIKLGEDFEKK